MGECRICLATLAETRSKEIVRPCMCRGSIQHVHQKCLKRWVLHSKRLTCQVCLYRYQLERSKVPFSVLYKKLISHLKRSQKRFILWFLWLLALAFPISKVQTIIERQEFSKEKTMELLENAYMLPVFFFSLVVVVVMMCKCCFCLY